MASRKTSPVDVVYLVREGENEELRYSLRSLAANVKHGTVWIVGHKPRWVRDVEHLPTRQGRDRYQNTLAAVHTACTHADITDDFQLWNDDFYALQPTDVPNWHLGPLDVSNIRSSNGPTHQGGKLFTYRLLKGWGIDPVLNYAVHVPMVINREKMVAALRKAGTGIRALHRRTLYGNLYDVGGEHVEDVIVPHRRGVWKPDAIWATSNDAVFAQGDFGRAIRAHFPDPSPYEES